MKPLDCVQPSQKIPKSCRAASLAGVGEVVRRSRHTSPLRLSPNAISWPTVEISGAVCAGSTPKQSIAIKVIRACRNVTKGVVDRGRSLRTSAGGVIDVFKGHLVEINWEQR